MVDLKIFPHLGAFPNELSSNNTVGGVGGSWPMNMPLNYWWNFGSRSTKRKSKKSIKNYRKKTSKRGRKSNRRRRKSNKRIL